MARNRHGYGQNGSLNGQARLAKRRGVAPWRGVGSRAVPAAHGRVTPLRILLGASVELLLPGVDVIAPGVGLQNVPRLLTIGDRASLQHFMVRERSCRRSQLTPLSV